MPEPTPENKPVGDSISKVDNAVAVGENLDFQRKWWRFEHAAWLVFSLIILCDIAGLFGRGPLANARKASSDGLLRLQYERIERTSTPSTMSFRFGPGAVQNGRIQVYINQSVVKELGAQRVSPQPASSVLGNGGLTYTFPATDANSLVQISLEPTHPGIFHLAANVVGSQPVNARIIVMP